MLMVYAEISVQSILTVQLMQPFLLVSVEVALSGTGQMQTTPAIFMPTFKITDKVLISSLSTVRQIKLLPSVVLVQIRSHSTSILTSEIFQVLQMPLKFFKVVAPDDLKLDDNS
jgi:hypothetical protein